MIATHSNRYRPFTARPASRFMRPGYWLGAACVLLVLGFAHGVAAQPPLAPLRCPAFGDPCLCVDATGRPIHVCARVSP